MPDYDLGRATGEVVITADVDDGVRGLRDYERATKSATDASKEQSRIEQELTNRRRTATEAAQKRKDAEAEYKRVMADSNSTAQQQIDAEERRNKARGEHLKATKAAAEAERAFRAELAGNTDAVRKFTRSLGEADNAVSGHTRRLKELEREARMVGRTLDSVGSGVIKVFASLGKATAIAGGGAAAGGLAGLLGAGGTQGLMAVLAGASSIIAQFSGALLVLPAAVGGAVTVLGTLKIATLGVGEAFKDMGDPAKFAEDLRKLAPAARVVVTEFAQFSDSFRGAQQVIQQGLFEPLIGEITPLVQTLLPLFMNGMREIASILGQGAKQFAQWARSGDSVAAFQTIFQNIAQALRVVMNAMRPMLDAFRTLGVVGSSVLPQISQMIVNAANSLNMFVSAAANDGRLKQWMENSLQAFSDLWSIIKNVSLALYNMFSLWNTGGTTTLSSLRRISEEFNNWTKSFKGQDSIAGFFESIKTAGNALMPILKIVGQGISTIIKTFVDLGTATAPGMESFFGSILQALKELAPNITAMAPAINQGLKSIGEAILGIVQKLGPQLPSLMQKFSDVIVDLAPHLVTLAEAFAKFLQWLTPDRIEVLLGIGAAFATLGSVIPAVISAITAVAGVAAALGISFTAAAGTILLVIGVIAALVAAGIWLYQNWDTVKEKAQQLWDKIKEFGNWIGGVFSSIWRSLVETVKEAWDSVTTAIANAISGIKNWFLNLPSEALNWGKNLIKNFAQGILDSIPGLNTVISEVAKIVPDFLLTHSPAKRGPLSEVSPNEMGSRLVGNFASGMNDNQSAVEGAASNTASGASNFTSAGVAGKSGQAGQSGFEQWASGLVQELSQWSQLFQHAFSLAQSVANVFVQGAKIVASLWNGGDNPMTRPGGIAGPPQLTKQQVVPGVPQVDVAGKAPLPELTPEHYGKKGDGSAVPQADVPGVPKAGDNGIAPANPPAQTQGQAPPSTAGTNTPASPSDSPLVSALKARGVSDKQIRLIQGFSQVEGNNPAGNPTLGFTDSQLGGATDINSHVDALLKQFKDRQGATTARGTTIGAFPEGGSDKEQAQWIADVVGQAGVSSDWQGNAQPKDYVGRVQQAIGGIPLPGAKPGEVLPGTAGFINPDFKIDTSTASVAGQAPPSTQGQAPAGYQNGIPYGLQHGTDTGGYGTGSSKVFPPWVMDLANRFGVKPSTYAGHQEGDRGGEAGYAPNPQGLNRGIDWAGSPDQMQAFAEFANSRAGRDMGLEQVIWENPNTGQRIGYGGGQDQSKTGYYANDWAEHRNHVHTRQASSWGSQDEQPQVGLRNNESPLEQTGGSWMQLPAGWDPNQPIPMEIRRANGVPDDMPPMYYAGSGKNAKQPTPKPFDPAEYQRQLAANTQGNWEQGIGRSDTPIDPTTGRPLGEISPPGLPPGTISTGRGDYIDPTNPQAGAQPYARLNNNQWIGVNNGQGASGASQQSPLDTFASGIAAAGNIAGDAFKVFDDVIQNIDATAKITATLIRGFENSEDVMKTIDEVQTYITTAADVAKLVSTISGTAASFAGAGASADPSGGTAGAAAALGSISAIAGLVNSALTAVNAGIDLGQEAARIAMKYGAMFSGIMLGNSETGALGGNVRMLLNTNTGEFISYSEDNPDLKSTKQLPSWMQRSYGGNGSHTTQVNQQTQLNLYTGPGANPNSLISDTMWLVNTGAPGAVSVSGQD